MCVYIYIYIYIAPAGPAGVWLGRRTWERQELAKVLRISISMLRDDIAKQHCPEALSPFMLRPARTGRRGASFLAFDASGAARSAAAGGAASGVARTSMSYKLTKSWPLLVSKCSLGGNSNSNMGSTTLFPRLLGSESVRSTIFGGIPRKGEKTTNRIPDQGRSRFDRFDLDTIRYFGFGFDVASIFGPGKPMLDRACYVKALVSIGSIAFRFRFEPPTLVILALPDNAPINLATATNVNGPRWGTFIVSACDKAFSQSCFKGN